jgi:protein NrfD
MLVYPHWTSVIALGSWALNAYVGLTFGLTVLAWKKADRLYDALIAPTWIVAFLATIYTAGLLGQATARELWSTPTEVAQMLLAATAAGSATFLVLGRGQSQDTEIFAWVLAISGIVALTIFGAELVFAPQKSEEAEYVIHALLSGSLGTLFWTGLVLGFALPAGLALVGLKRNVAWLFPVAGLSCLVGLWMVKHAWLIAPQLLPLS